MSVIPAVPCGDLSCPIMPALSRWTPSFGTLPPGTRSGAGTIARPARPEPAAARRAEHVPNCVVQRVARRVLRDLCRQHGHQHGIEHDDVVRAVSLTMLPSRYSPVVFTQL